MWHWGVKSAVKVRKPEFLRTAALALALPLLLATGHLHAHAMDTEGSLLVLLPETCHPEAEDTRALVQELMNAERQAPRMRRRSWTEPPPALPSVRVVHAALQGPDAGLVAAALIALHASDPRASVWLEDAATPAGAGDPCQVRLLLGLRDLVHRGVESEPHQAAAARVLLAHAGEAPASFWERLVVQAWLRGDAALLAAVAAVAPGGGEVGSIKASAEALMEALHGRRSAMEAWPIPEPEEPEEGEEGEDPWQRHDTWTLWVAAEVLRHRGEPAHALRLATVVLTRDPLHAPASLSRMASQMQLGDPGAAAEELRHLQLTAAEDPNVARHLREAARGLGVE